MQPTLQCRSDRKIIEIIIFWIIILPYLHHTTIIEISFLEIAELFQEFLTILFYFYCKILLKCYYLVVIKY